MSALEDRLEQALTRIAALEAGGGRNDRALSGWERFRAFFTGRTKYDGTGIQMLVGQPYDDVSNAGILAFVTGFEADITNPSAAPGAVTIGTIDLDPTPTVTFYTVQTLDLANFMDGLDSTGASYALDFIDMQEGYSQRLIKVEDDNGNKVSLDMVADTLTNTFDLYADNVTVRGRYQVHGDSVLTPSQITSNQDNYNPTNLRIARVLRLSTDASRDITGITNGTISGRLLAIVNVGSQNIVLKDESASSTEANRFALKGDITIAPDGGVELLYDTTTDRWRCVGVY